METMEPKQPRARRSFTPEFHEVLGYHLEQAMDHRRASGIGGAGGAQSLTGPSGRQPIDEAHESP